MLCRRCGQGVRAEFIEFPYEPPTDEELRELQRIVHSPIPYKWKPVYWWEVLAEKRIGRGN